LLDFSNKAELSFLSALASAYASLAADVPYYLAGATARDLLLQHAHDINPGRDTRDLDLAIMVQDWETFASLRSRLLDGGRFAPRSEAVHELWFDGLYEVDLIPFGAVEQADRTIAWPPDGDFVMNAFGFREAYGSTQEILLPEGERLKIVSLPALAVLKLTAWSERRLIRPGADAYDLELILRHYLDAGNQERLYAEAAHLLDAEGFDYELAGAWLLGHDMAQLLPPAVRPRLSAILDGEIDVQGPLRLVGDMRTDATRGLALLQHLATGFRETIDQ